MKIWLCELNNNNGGCYNPLHQTKKDLIADITELQEQPHPYKDDFEAYEVYQIDVDTSNVFDLLAYATSEGGGRYSTALGEVIQTYKVTNISGKFGLKRI